MEKRGGKRQGGMGREKGMGEGGKLRNQKFMSIIVDYNAALHLVTGTVHTVS